MHAEFCRIYGGIGMVWRHFIYSTRIAFCSLRIKFAKFDGKFNCSNLTEQNANLS